MGQVPLIVTLVPATKLGVDVPVPPLATGSSPVTPVVSGKPVALVNVPEVGVPKAPLYPTKPLAAFSVLPSAANTFVP